MRMDVLSSSIIPDSMIHRSIFQQSRAGPIFRHSTCRGAAGDAEAFAGGYEVHQARSGTRTHVYGGSSSRRHSQESATASTCQLVSTCISITYYM